MKASQHWKHRLKKKFGMGKQARLAKKPNMPGSPILGTRTGGICEERRTDK